MARSRFRPEFPARFVSNRNTQETLDDSNAPFPEQSADRCRPEFYQTLRLLRAAALAAPLGSRPVCCSARHASWKCFPENRRSNQQADEVVSGKLPARYHRALVDLALLFASSFHARTDLIVAALWQLPSKLTRFIIRAAPPSKRLFRFSMPVRLSVTLISTRTMQLSLPIHWSAPSIL